MDGAKPCIGHRFRVHSALMNATRVLIVAYRRRRAPLVAMSLLTMLLAVQGCAVDWTREHRLYCRMDERLLVRDTLYFGLSIPGGGEVSEADWRHFESDDLTRAFPKGFTVLDAHGAWRGANGDTVHELARVVIVVHEDDATSKSAVDNAVRNYQAAFHQEAVLHERAAVCVSP